MSNLRDLFSRSDKEKLSPDLKRALSFLQISDLQVLEERFLAADGFLKPWAVFRDSIFLLQPDAMPRATLLKRSEEDNGISRLDVLWFYTQFDENTRRYDPRADKYSIEYTPDSSLYGLIDKSEWGVQEYEKHLYAWLLQEFKVGKARNPGGFDYFELKNVCSAWEEVLVPIVNAVRASYNVKGRRYYGRLALFIEGKCPSGLAFPEGNVGIPEGGLMSPTPFRVVSVPKKTTNNDGVTFHKRVNSIGVLTKKHYDETEKELRDVYPQYGGLVERPKFKHKMEEWLAEQRARAIRRKAAEGHGEVKSFQYNVVDRDGSRSPFKRAPTPSYPGRRTSNNGIPSPIKRYSDSIRRSLSLNISKGTPKDEPKSPLHGVTRQVIIPDDDQCYPSSTMPNAIQAPRQHRVSSMDSTGTVITEMPRPNPQGRKASEQSVYTSIRNSNPFIEDLPEDWKAARLRAATSTSVFSPMGQLSAIPGPLRYEAERDQPAEAISVVHQKKSYADVRVPSYEGTGYADEISLTNLHTGRKHSVRTPEPVRPTKPPTRLPLPIHPIPYAGTLRAASKETNLNAPPRPIAWPGFESNDDFVPPIPSKSPARMHSTRGHVRGSGSWQLGRDNSHNLTRIVSKENIRAALGSISRESSAEELAPPMPKLSQAEGLTRTMSPGETKLNTYNTHLFPRKGTPMGNTVAENKRRYEAGGAYEKEVLMGGKKKG